MDLFFASRARLTFIIYMKHFKFYSKKAILSDVHFSGGKKEKHTIILIKEKKCFIIVHSGKETNGIILSTFF